MIPDHPSPVRTHLSATFATLHSNTRTGAPSVTSTQDLPRVFSRALAQFRFFPIYHLTYLTIQRLLEPLPQPRQPVMRPRNHLHADDLTDLRRRCRAGVRRGFHGRHVT